MYWSSWQWSCAIMLASRAAKLTYISSQKVNAGILLLTLQLTCILLAEGLLRGISLSLVNMITVASECQVLAKDKPKGQSTTHFRNSICHGKLWFTFLVTDFFPVKREVQNTHYKTLNRVKFACLWGWTSFSLKLETGQTLKFRKVLWLEYTYLVVGF